MIIKAITASCLKDYQTITIGRQMEDNHRQFIFDCSGFDEEVTSVELVHQRSEDVAPYPVTTASTDTLTWTVTDTDTAYAGGGRAELRIRFANGMAKTAVFNTSVIASITGDTVIPEPLESWYDALIDYIDDHAATPEQIEAAVEAYLEDHPIPAPVTSVNGKQGAVVLTATDVGAMPSSYTAPVTSVNTKTGAVVLDASDVGAYEKPNTGIPKTDLASDVQASLNRADTALQSAPVTSVNSKTGAVTITAQELGALTSESDPVFSASPAAGITAQDISNWDNKSDFSGSYNDLTNKPSIPAAGLPAGGSTGQVLTKASGADYDAAWQTPSAGGSVDSVNGQTGTVVLDADDVGALPDTTTAADLGAYVKPSGGIPKTDLANDVQTSLGKADTALQTAPVTSVNGQTGAVVIPVGGLTQAQIDALDGMFRVAAYAEDATAEYAAFCTAFGITQTYSITNTLTHVTNSNAATSISGGSSYTGTLTADSGYNIDTVTVTMGGVDITATAYSGGSISIANVTGNIVITATASTSSGKSDMNGWTDGVAYTDLTIVQDEYVNKNNGNFDSYTGWNRTGYVPIDGASTLTISKMSGGGGGSGYNAFYTQNHTFISSFEMVHTGPVTVTVPSNAYYFVLSETAAQLNQVLTDGVVPNA